MNSTGGACATAPNCKTSEMSGKVTLPGRRLENKVAIVTGAAGGLGYEISRTFFDQGAKVALLDRDRDRLQSAKEQLGSADDSPIAIVCDIGSSAAVGQSIAQVLGEFGGRIDVLVNNAAVAVPGDITRQSDEEWLALFNVNLLGAVRCVRAVLPTMVQQTSGSIISIGSLQGERAWEHWTAYAAAKGALRAMTRQLAGQFGPDGVRFNMITPGAMLTPLNEERRAREGDSFFEAAARMHALGRMGRADEVCGAAVFLASDESSFVTGSDLAVDGGASVMPRC